ncbi:MAG: CaiB/BaiF CoA-transferase family protein [Dehalococcoidia bacterium]|nr:CaiB/BaiF CoA-transferase family protein [Dehalococcoidia bacterium]
MGALSDIIVLDMSRILAGPFGTQILADLGATVWKIESPWGDDTRGWGPPFVGTESAYYLSANRGKKSLIVNLRDPRGQDIIKKMAQKADVVVENFKVGNLKRFGLDYESLSAVNPGIIYSSVTGFGQTGPRAEEPGYDAALQGMTGVMSVTGEPDGRPSKVGAAWIDILTGLTSTIGILSALHERETSGKGQHIDVSLFDVGIAMMANIAQSYLATKEIPGRLGNAHPQVAPYQDFRASDGFFMLAANNNDQFRRLCDTVGLPDLPDDERFKENADRVRNRETLETLINEKMGANTRDYWMHALQKAGITVTSINTVADALEDPQAAARKSVWDIDHPTLGSVPVLASALQHMSRTPAQAQGHPPLLGEHTEDVLRNDLGVSGDEIQALIADGVVKGRSES